MGNRSGARHSPKPAGCNHHKSDSPDSYIRSGRRCDYRLDRGKVWPLTQTEWLTSPAVNCDRPGWLALRRPWGHCHQLANLTFLRGETDYGSPAAKLGMMVDV